MEYLLLIHGDESRAATQPEAVRSQTVAAYRAYTETLRQSGVLRGSNRLRPTASATVVRVKGEATEVQNGPFADTREALGGYYLIDVPDLDAALAWAARCPAAAMGAVEVRPIWPMDAY
jgi:hypothetical protein